MGTTVDLVHLVRHGLPIQVDSAQGVPDPPLSTYGRRQADAVAAWWSHRPASGVLTSQLCRARETGSPLASMLGLEPQVDEGLAEFTVGEDFYLPITDVFAVGDHPRITRWRSRLGKEEMVEARSVFQRNAITTFDRITDAPGDEPLLVFTHGGYIAAVLSHVLGRPSALALDADYASITTLRRKPTGGWMVVSFSETQHLAHLGAPRHQAGISLET